MQNNVFGKNKIEKSSKSKSLRAYIPDIFFKKYCDEKKK